MNLLKKYCIPLIITVIYVPVVFSQSKRSDSTRKELKESRPAYLTLSAGVNISSFRDFATSPLYYSGLPLYTSISHVDIDDKRQSDIAISYAFGPYNNDFNQQLSVSEVKTFSINYLELFQVNQLSTTKLNIKVGGLFSTTANIRNNEQLFNNSKGVDVIATLFGSLKGTLDLSTREETQKKFLFINYLAKKRSRNLSLTVNFGLLNSSYRNGFAYTSQSPVLNEDRFFDGYRLRIFSGYRLSSAVDYTVFLRNKNAVQIAYLWDAYRTGGGPDEFEMVAHVLKFSLLYSLK